MNTASPPSPQIPAAPAPPVGPSSDGPNYQMITLVCWIALSFFAAVGAFLTSVDEWYLQLRKPWWNPPSWLFEPAWSVLYLLMGTAAWLVWREGGWRAQRRALGLFIAQWFLNALWSPLFFGLHRPGLAFAEIILFWFSVALTTYVFWLIKRSAGILMLPYLAWVTFAAVLNFTIWRMNM